MSWNIDFSIGGGRQRPVERIDERIIVTPGREIIEETITRGPYRERIEETIITGPRREIIEERVVVGPRREIIEERVVIDRPGDPYPRNDPPPPYSSRSYGQYPQSSAPPAAYPSLPTGFKPMPVVTDSYLPNRINNYPPSHSYRTPSRSYGQYSQSSAPRAAYPSLPTRVKPMPVVTVSYLPNRINNCKSFHGYRTRNEWVPPSHCRGTLTWVECFGGQVPSDPVHAGVDKDNSPIYAGRAWHDGDLLPAKVTPSHGCAYVSYAGSEISKDRYEVLCSRHVAWKEDADGHVPVEAIVCGQTASGERLFMGRCMYDGTITVGKVHPSHHCIYIPYNGREVSHRMYEVLVLC